MKKLQGIKKIKGMRAIAIIICILLMTVAFASCGASNKVDIDLAPEYDMMEDGEIGTGSSMPSYGEKEEMADSATGKEETDEYSPKIIKTANLSTETKDFENAIAEIEAEVKSLGGYIESCNIQNVSYGRSSSTVEKTRYANYVIRIPADKLDEFLSDAGELLNVVSSSSNAVDVSGEYYDIEARIGVLESERQVIERLLSEAKDIDTMITLEKRLYSIIYEIESYKTAIKVYDSKVAYSTVNLSISEVKDLTDTTVSDSFGTRFKKAVSETAKGTVDFAEETVIALVYATPFLCAIAIGAVVCVAVVMLVVLTVKGIVKRSRRNKGQ